MNNPIKPSLKTEIVPLFFILISVVASFFFYFKFPDQVIISWNFAGEADGWGPKGMAAFLFPIIMIFVYFLLLLIPITDPKKDRYEEFRGVYHKFKAMFVIFFAIIYFIASLQNIGFNFNIGMIIPGLAGIMLLVIGNYLGKVKRNWFLGIRTPWTLASDNVWNKTNRFGGKVFMAMGALMIIIGLFPNRLFFIVSIALFIVLLLSVFVYSYIIYTKEQKDKKQDNSFDRNKS